MGWYIATRNCINRPALKQEWSKSIVWGTPEVCQRISGLISEFVRKESRPCAIAFDGFLGADWTAVVAGIGDLLRSEGSELETTSTNTLFKPMDWIDRFAKPYLTNDPSFGVVNGRWGLGHLFEVKKLAELRGRIANLKRGMGRNRCAAFICYGVGAALFELKDAYDYVFYFDITRETLLNRMGRGEVTPLGADTPASVYWKRLYYVETPMLIKHKKSVIKTMDFYVESNAKDDLRLVAKAAYDGIIATMVRYPLKFRRVFMPGPWGGRKFRTYFDLPELDNCAWNIEVSGMDSSLMVNTGGPKDLDIPFWNFYSQFPIEMVGPYCTKNYPGNFPIQVGIDDGYFPESVPHERRAMPVHLHPDSNYVRRNFKESVGRYEVYYIVEAYEGANTMHGFWENADIEKFKQEVRKSAKEKTTFDFQKYVKCWPSKAGELYLIPAGTCHGTGGNQMVLEMDTCPSSQGTEYSFFLYDYCRNTWDDRSKTWTGKPVKLQVEHGIRQCRFGRKEKWVAEHIRPKPVVRRKGDGWSEEQFESYAAMPYHIERLNFDRRIQTDTRSRFFHFLCLTRGTRVAIRSIAHPERQIELEYIQCTVVPASFGKYECVNLGGTPCTITRQRWKRG
jgi:hypothetical protein